ncbi:protein of unknown function [Bradyrhizobium vignae]|uniref:Uncharacterized protein n=1 Tax=Bradyrhizobium vignae TaxID=1549949 RepID=A0A2U3PTC1_9BRAD|nr:protein of unknown function [Bradyrhizobium vignae]
MSTAKCSVHRRDAIVLERGKVEAAPDDLYVDCTAKAFRKRPSVSVFDAEEITRQQVRPGRLSLSAALIAHVEASYGDDAIKNDLCAPIPSVELAADYLSTMLDTLRNERRWGPIRSCVVGSTSIGYPALVFRTPA